MWTSIPPTKFEGFLIGDRIGVNPVLIFYQAATKGIREENYKNFKVFRAFVASLNFYSIYSYVSGIYCSLKLKPSIY